jgi:hypothetical protein
MRQLDALVVAGQVSAFSRDLSPLQLGARGSFDGKDFTIVGVLRKARENVRWNEWYLSFSDGTDGYLGEGGGYFQIFAEPPRPVSQKAASLKPGNKVELGGIKWTVIEAATARIVAADGTLPFAAVQNYPAAYADLRSMDGRQVGTLDAVDNPPSLWVGKIVHLTALQMEGLRPITGWSDPVLTNFHGPEVTQVRTLSCPKCGGSITLRAPGAAVNIGCEYCGSELAIHELGDQTTAKVLQARDSVKWRSSLKLGARGEFDSVQWEIIGVMGRHVVFDFIKYHWTEYFLYNPYRGFRYLVEDGRGHWSFVRPMPDTPDAVGGGRASYRGRTYRHYTGGKAHVNRVLGEFSWQVRVGDVAMTDDYISPPYMLSAERDKHELNWSHGEYMTPDQIGDAFGVALDKANGIAPHIPNPFAEANQNRKAWTFAMLLLGGAIALFLGQAVTASNDVLLSQTWGTATLGQDVFLTEPFVVPDSVRRNLHVAVSTRLSRSFAQVHVALVNTDDGATYMPLNSAKGNTTDGRLWRVSPGNYVGRIQVAWHPDKPGQTDLGGLKLTVIRDKPWRAPLFLLAFYALLAPIVLVLAKGAFETKRWSESDHAG